MSRSAALRRECAEAECAEVAFWDHSSQRDMRNHARRLAEQPWRCVLKAVRGPTGSLFWHDGERLGSGFTHGPGFKAFANDFAEGAVLTITATVTAPSVPADPTETEPEEGQQ